MLILTQLVFLPYILYMFLAKINRSIDTHAKNKKIKKTEERIPFSDVDSGLAVYAAHTHFSFPPFLAACPNVSSMIRLHS